MRRMLALAIVAVAFVGVGFAQDPGKPDILPLPKEGTFEGVVLGQGLEKIFPPRINPVAGAEITLSLFPSNDNLPPGTGVVQGVPVWTARSQKDGSFRFADLRPGGIYRWSASHPDFGSAEGKFELGKGRGHYARVLLQRRPGPGLLGAFAGRVTSRAFAIDRPDERPGVARPVVKETPVAGAIVEVHAAPTPIPLPRPLPVEPQPEPAADPKPGISPPKPPERAWRAETDKNGTFVIKGLPLGAYTFRVRHKEHAPAGGRFALTEKEPRIKRAITLERRVQGVFAGEVFERVRLGRPDGAEPKERRIALPKPKPIAGAIVSVWRARPRPVPVPPTKPTDPRPEPKSDDPSGGTGGGAPEEETDVPDDKGEAEDGNEGGGGADGNAGGGAVDDDDPGSDDGTATQTVEFKGAPDEPISTKPTKPIVKRRVRRAKTDENGAFAMKGLPAGIYRFTVRAKGYTTRRGMFAISPRHSKVHRRIALAKAGGGGNQPASFSGVVLTIQLPGTVRPDDPNPGGIVTPVPGAIVRLTLIPPPNVKMLPFETKTTTDKAGEFAFKDLRAGQYVATVEADGFFGIKESIQIAGDTRRKFYIKPTALPPVAPPKPVEQPGVQGSDTENPFK